MSYPKNAVDFLLYESMKLTRKDLNPFNKEAYLGKILNKAYNDATLQGAFNALVYKGESKEELKIQLVGKDAKGNSVSVDGGCCKERAEKQIIEFIESLPRGSACTQEDYDERHDELCRKIFEEFEKGLYPNGEKKDGECYFTYGNAQKWINMTMKYLYVVEGVCPEDACPELPRIATPLAKVLHIPVDRYIIEAIFKLDKDKAPADRCLPLVDESHDKYVLSKVKLWSKWNEDDYKIFKDNVRALIDEENLLDWESRVWPEMAESNK